MIIIDKNFFLNNATEAGGWTSAQLKLLGVKYPLRSGWQRRLYGEVISEKTALAFKEAGKIYKKSTLRRKAKEERAEINQLTKALENSDHKANYNLPFDLDSRIHSMESNSTSH